MKFTGEVVFKIMHSRDFNHDFNEVFNFYQPKSIKIGQQLNAGYVATKSIWYAEFKFIDEDDFYNKVNLVADLLFEKNETIEMLKDTYENVEIDIYVRSDYGQFGFSFSQELIKKLSLTNLDVEFHFLSFGEVED